MAANRVGVNWIYLIWNRDKLQALVNAVMNFRVLWNVGNVFTI